MKVRCRLFGHRWGMWIDGCWHAVDWYAGGAVRYAFCKRCETRYIDTLPRKQTFENLVERVRDGA